MALNVNSSTRFPVDMRQIDPIHGWAVRFASIKSEHETFVCCMSCLASDQTENLYK